MNQDGLALPVNHNSDLFISFWSAWKPWAKYDRLSPWPISSNEATNSALVAYLIIR
jgi:hypothetical protein